MNREDIIRELWEGCGEQLELIEPEHWDSLMCPVLIKLLQKARIENDVLRKRLQYVGTNSK